MIDHRTGTTVGRVMLVLVLVSSFVMLSAFSDKPKKNTPCSLTCRIIEILDPHQAVVVERVPPNTATDKHIVVVTDKDTRIGRNEQPLRFEDLRVGMTIHVEGFEWFRGNHGCQVTAILAQVIRPTIH